MSNLPAPSGPRLRLTCGQPAWRERLCLALAAQGWQVVEHAEGIPEQAAAPDAVLHCLGAASTVSTLLADPALPAEALDSAVVVLAEAMAEDDEAALIAAGVESVLIAGPALQEAVDAVGLHRALRQALGRKQLERAARRAYATDLATGLPHQAQLLEHMTQLLALREREPAPMVLLALRVDGFEQAAARLGAEAGNVLRRKVAVRLRAGLRASDVVAAIGDDIYAVLLGRLEAKGDGERVARKLVQALQSPLSVAGQPCRVAAAVGLSVFPDHGKDARALLMRAVAQAGSRPSNGAGFAQAQRLGGPPAANEPG
jgi:diguanylate cyclase (GGDEF)-like protein